MGKPIPNYKFSNILNSEKSEVSLDALKGKPVILEFWATWCGPCIPAMKKLDSLQKNFGDKIEIITISSERKERLEKFIKTSKTSLPIVSDTTHYDYFKYKVIPHSILIDKNGIVRAITGPENINENVIESMLAKNEIELEPKDDFQSSPTKESTIINSISNRDYTIELRSYEPQKRGILYVKDIDGKNNGIKMWNRTLDIMYKTLFDIPSFNRIIYKDSLSEKDFPFEEAYRYSLLIETSEKFKNNWKQLGIDVLNKSFDINARKSIDLLNCYILKNIDNTIKESIATESEYKFMGSILKMKKTGISTLVNYLEKFTDHPVVDSTDLVGKYDIELDWFEDDPKTLFSELKKYGLKLEKYDKRLPVEVMEIYRKK
ncbi:redoxin domain-containing protein [Leptobacterium flavescens]|uniref:Redoxin domain-containing protein n=1 Tax=Leptobacterium flavescens TaxID=472055 RepID=A0A6P0USM1_9FLAO|nr:redoxin domain-containing protein [Leptobacterium flavescens]NER15552.1 redoxin domain-containing protein [Leptobacterium flavescens]